MNSNKTLEANIAVHAALANSGEYNKSPHFRAENQARVLSILKELLSAVPDKDQPIVLDMGCGTGFILHLLSPYVAHAYGIDITDAMMSQVDRSLGNVTLEIKQAENTGYENEKFDLVTAYSFLDHLVDYTKVLHEAFRVLKDGGIFYADLNPNRAFSDLMLQVESSEFLPSKFPHAISREIKGMLHNGEYYEEKYGINEETLRNAEPQKSTKMGFDWCEIQSVSKNVGFSSVEVIPHWFLGQGVLMNSESNLDLTDIEQYLQAMLPASVGFFKYFRFVFQK